MAFGLFAKEPTYGTHKGKLSVPLLFSSCGKRQREEKSERENKPITIFAMFFVWTSDGGPLQYVGLALFLLQLVPHLLSTYTTTPQQTPSSSTTTAMMRQEDHHVVDDEREIVVPYNEMFMSLAQLFMIAFVPVLIFVTLVYANYDELRSSVLQVRNRTQRLLRRCTTSTIQRLVGLVEGQQEQQQREQVVAANFWTPFTTSCFLGAFVGIVVWVALQMDASTIVSSLQIVAFGVAIYTHLFDGPLGRLRRQREETQEENNNQIEKLVMAVSKMPIEEFVPDDVSTMNALSISQIKDMLQYRGISNEELKLYVDRHNLLETLKRKRKCDDTCCICLQTYELNDPIRIIPNCYHELHVECLDQWIYTFAPPPISSNTSGNLSSSATAAAEAAARRKLDPTCPLCKGKVM